jgi:hypothetical protein
MELEKTRGKREKGTRGVKGQTVSEREGGEKRRVAVTVLTPRY